MCLKGPVTAMFGSSEPFCMEKWVCQVGAIPTQRVYQLSNRVIYTAIASIYVYTSFNRKSVTHAKRKCTSTIMVRFNHKSAGLG